MVTALWTWVRGIALLLLLILGVELLMPRSSFRAYLRLVAGMILVLAVLEPVLGVLKGTAPALSLPASSPAAARSLAGNVQAEVDRQVREAFRARVAAAVRDLLVASSAVSEARVEVTLAGAGFDITAVSARVRATPGARLGPAELERLRDVVAGYLGISRECVMVRGG